MTTEQIMAALAWIGLALWLGALALAIAHRYRAAAVLTGMLAVPFLVPAVFTLLRWGIDAEGYVRQYGTAALTELRLTAVIAALSVLVLIASAAAYRGRIRWGALAWLIDGAGLAFLFYLAYFFRIF